MKTKEYGEAFGSFSEIVADVLSKAKHDPVQHILVLTYEFDEQQLLNLVSGHSLEDDFELRQKQLQLIAAMRPLVIYDARKTKEGSRLPQFLELHPYNPGAWACHHSKAYLIITSKTVRLVLGSFNLTNSGLFKNREVYEEFSWDADARESIHILREFIEFLEQQYGDRLHASSRSSLLDILATLRARVVKLDHEGLRQTDQHLLISGYGGAIGLEQLRQRWDEWFPGREPTSALAVSPFFDSNPTHSCLASRLQAEFTRLEELTLVSDESAFSALSRAHFASVQNCRLMLIPAGVDERELDEIQEQGKSTRDLVIQRALHAKLLFLSDGYDCLAYLGSANFTCKAWIGSNQELGLVWKASGFENLKAIVLEHLGVQERDRWEELPPLPSQEAQGDDEEYADARGFPDFIERIWLRPNDGCTAVRFEFEYGQRDNNEVPSDIGDYLVSWAGQTLEITDRCSQWLDRTQFQTRLIGGRNLTFVRRDVPDTAFWLPYQYLGALMDDRESFLHPSSLDWMDYYLNPERDSNLPEGEHLPGDAEDEVRANEYDPQDFSDVQRGENCVIAMQAYLNLFQRVERDFRARLEKLKHDDWQSEPARLQREIVAPLDSLSRILEREAANSHSRSAFVSGPGYVFKLGELSRLVMSLMEDGPVASAAFSPLHEKLTRLLEAERGKDRNSLQSLYIDFILPREGVCAQ